MKPNPKKQHKINKHQHPNGYHKSTLQHQHTHPHPHPHLNPHRYRPTLQHQHTHTHPHLNPHQYQPTLQHQHTHTHPHFNSIPCNNNNHRNINNNYRKQPTKQQNYQKTRLQPNQQRRRGRHHTNNNDEIKPIISRSKSSPSKKHTYNKNQNKYSRKPLLPSINTFHDKRNQGEYYDDTFDNRYAVPFNYKAIHSNNNGKPMITNSQYLQSFAEPPAKRRKRNNSYSKRSHSTDPKNYIQSRHKQMISDNKPPPLRIQEFQRESRRNRSHDKHNNHNHYINNNGYNKNGSRKRGRNVHHHKQQQCHDKLLHNVNRNISKSSFQHYHPNINNNNNNNNNGSQTRGRNERHKPFHTDAQFNTIQQLFVRDLQKKEKESKVYRRNPTTSPNAKKTNTKKLQRKQRKFKKRFRDRIYIELLAQCEFNCILIKKENYKDCKDENCSKCLPFRLDPNAKQSFTTHAFCDCKNHRLCAEGQYGQSFAANGFSGLSRHLRCNADHHSFRKKYEQFIGRKIKEINKYIDTVIAQKNNTCKTTKQTPQHSDQYYYTGIVNNNKNQHHSNDINDDKKTNDANNDTNILFSENMQNHMNKLSDLFRQRCQEEKQSTPNEDNASNEYQPFEQFAQSNESQPYDPENIIHDWDNVYKDKFLHHLTIRKYSDEFDPYNILSQCKCHQKDGLRCELTIHKRYYQKVYDSNKYRYLLVDILYCETHDLFIDLLRQREQIILDASERINRPPFDVIVPINSSCSIGGDASKHTHVTRGLLISVLQELSSTCNIKKARESIIGRYGERMHEELTQLNNYEEYISLDLLKQEADTIFPKYTWFSEILIGYIAYWLTGNLLTMYAIILKHPIQEISVDGTFLAGLLYYVIDALLKKYNIKMTEGFALCEFGLIVNDIDIPGGGETTELLAQLIAEPLWTNFQYSQFKIDSHYHFGSDACGKHTKLFDEVIKIFKQKASNGEFITSLKGNHKYYFESLTAELSTEWTHYYRLYKKHINQSLPIAKEYNSIFYELCRKSTLYPVAYDLSNYPYQNDIAAEIRSDISSMPTDVNLTSMREVIDIHFQKIHTYSAEKIDDLKQRMESHSNVKQITQTWIKFIVNKYPPSIACIVLYILSPAMTKEIFLATDAESTCEYYIKTKDGSISAQRLPGWELPAHIYNQFIVFAELESKYFKPLLSYHQPKTIQIAFLSAINFLRDRHVYQHPQDRDSKGKAATIPIASKRKWVKTRVMELFNAEAIQQLFNNCKMADGRHIGSNKNEHVHGLKKEMTPALKAFGHRFWSLLRPLFIIKYNKSSLNFVWNNQDLFSIQSVQWLQELSVFFDKVYGFEHIKDDRKQYYIEARYNNDYIENKDKLNIENCKKNKWIKKTKKKERWDVEKASELLVWTHEKAKQGFKILNDELVNKCVSHYNNAFSADFIYYKLKYHYHTDNIQCYYYPQNKREMPASDQIINKDIKYIGANLTLHMHYTRDKIITKIKAYFDKYSRDEMNTAWINFVTICRDHDIKIAKKAKSVFDLTKGQMIYYVQESLCRACHEINPDSLCEKCCKKMHSKHLVLRERIGMICAKCDSLM